MPHVNWGGIGPNGWDTVDFDTGPKSNNVELSLRELELWRLSLHNILAWVLSTSTFDLMHGNGVTAFLLFAQRLSWPVFILVGFNVTLVYDVYYDHHITINGIDIHVWLPFCFTFPGLSSWGTRLEFVPNHNAQLAVTSR